MRKAGAKGAPKKSDFANAEKTASFKEGGSIEQLFKPTQSDFNTKVMGGWQR
jgi:hypothetical protein